VRPPVVGFPVRFRALGGRDPHRKRATAASYQPAVPGVPLNGPTTAEVTQPP
jgi:hypothetical protein